MDVGHAVYPASYLLEILRKETLMCISYEAQAVKIGVGSLQCLVKLFLRSPSSPEKSME